MSPGYAEFQKDGQQIRLRSQGAPGENGGTAGDALIEIVQLADGNRIQVGLAETTTELARAANAARGVMRETVHKGASCDTLRACG